MRLRYGFTVAKEGSKLRPTMGSGAVEYVPQLSQHLYSEPLYKC